MKQAFFLFGAVAALGFGSPAIAQDGKDVVTASGEVVGTTQIQAGASETRDLVKLRRTDGGTVIVDLGPAAAQVQPGDRVSVQGHSARISGKPVIFARYVGELREIERTGEAGAAAGGSGAPGGEWKYDDFGYFRDELEWTSDDPAFLSFYSDAENAWDAYRSKVNGDGSRPVRR